MMMVFCPSCGTQNDASPGSRANCVACGSTFDVPSGETPRQPPVRAAEAEAAPPPSSFSAPGAQVFAGPLTATPRSAAGRFSPLAITSLVAGLVCCIPILSPGVAIGCGVASLRAIDAGSGERGRGLAIAGIILGVITALVQILGGIGSVAGR